MSSTLTRLKERKLVAWALAYLGGSWLIMQLVDVLSDHWPLPLGLQRGIDLVIVIGFFVTLTIAWYHGEKGRQQATGPELLIIASLLFIAGTLLVVFKPVEPVSEITAEPEPALRIAQEGITGIAVLPLRNLSGNADQEYFVAGMHEALISSLSKVDALKVISRTSVMRYADSDKSIPEIARELNVDALIEGSVNPVGERVRITVQLIDAQTDTHLWADEYDRDLKDVLVLLSQIAASVVEMVEATLAPQYKEALRSAKPVDPQLNDLYMRGRFSYTSFSKDGLERSAKYFQQAIEIDPTFAPAWAGLSVTHILSAYLGVVPPAEAMAAAESTALRTLALDNQLALAHTALGWVRLLQFNWDEARQTFERALQLNPNDPDALHGLGDYLTITGNGEEGLSFVKKAKEVDPFSPMWASSVVGHLYMMRRFEEAISEAEKVIDLYPNSSSWGTQGNAYYQLGHLDEALHSYRKEYERRPELLAALEQGNSKNGPVGAIRAIADSIAQKARQTRSNAFDVAIWYARAGDVEEAMAWLEKAYTQGSPDLIYVGVRPEFDIMYSVPGFKELIERMKISVSGKDRKEKR
jgi:TolB-like protein/Flp pilus assembly protein TadD